MNGFCQKERVSCMKAIHLRRSLKRVLCALLALALAASLCACGPDQGPDASGTPGTDTPAPVAQAPSRGKPDKSGLLYASALDGYKKTDWTAEWIWTEHSPADTYVALRKTFTLDSAVPSATAYISAESKYTLYVNGELVVMDGSFKRGPTPYDAYYDTVELTGLKAGENTVVAVVAFNGKGAYSSTAPLLLDELGEESPQGGFLFEMKAGDTTIRSDATWKVLRLPMYKNATTVRTYTVSAMLAERSAWYDAREDVGDFTAPSFDDSAWEAATPIAKAGELPYGELYDPLLSPPVPKTLVDFENAADYVGKATAQDTTVVLELPGNIQFNLYLELTAPAGAVLTYHTDSYEFGSSQSANSFKDTYITKDGSQSYLQLAWRSGSKVFIETPAGVTFTRLAYMPTSLNSEITGSFTCSNERLTTLWRKALNTVAVCVRDNPMDCPDRERSIYAGDVSNEGSVMLYAYDEAGANMVKKMLLSYMGWIRTNGVIPSQAPSTVNKELPVQSLSLFDVAYQYWLHSGDEATMRDWYAASLNYLLVWEMKDGLPVHRAGDWDWSDWGDHVDADAVQAGYYYYALGITARLGQELGITEGAQELSGRMTAMKGAYRAAYYTENGFKSASADRVDERANAIFALSGLCEESDWELVTSVISTTAYASPYFERFVLKALGEMGRDEELAERMLTKYGGMIDDEIDTLWEMFDKDAGTFNHGWAAGPLYAIDRYLAGIRPTAPGWESYEIAPADVLDGFQCTVPTTKGSLTAEFRRGDGETVLTVSAIDARGTVVIPASMGSVAAVSGGEYTQDGNTVVLAGAGEYTITIQ